MSTKNLKIVNCPVCGEEITPDELPEPKEDLNSVAINHGDHIAVVKYDKNKRIISVSAYPISITEEGAAVEICPICEREIPIPAVREYPTELVYNHVDHVVIVYLYDPDLYTLETMPLITVTKPPKKELMKAIIDFIGVQNLANIVARVAVGEKTVKYPHKSGIKLLNEMFEKMGLDEIKVEEGEVEYLPEDFYIFFQKIIENNIRVPDILISKLLGGITLVSKLSNLINSLYKRGLSDEQLKEFVDMLKKKDLYLLIIRRLQNDGHVDVATRISGI